MEKAKKIFWFRVFILTVLPLLMISLGYRYWESYKRKTTHKIVKDVLPVPVEVISVKKASREIVGVFRGILKPARDTLVSAKVSGTMEKLYVVDEGEHVKKNQTIMLIDDELLVIALDEASARYEKAKVIYDDAKRDLKQKEKLRKDNIVSQDDLIRAQVNLKITLNEKKTLEADMRRKQKNLNDATVKVPFDGIISELLVDEGETVFTATPLFKVMDVSELKIHFFTTDIELPSFKIGLPLSFTVDAYPGREFISKVVSIDPEADKDYLNFDIVARYDNTETENYLHPGMVVRISAKLGMIDEAFFVPADVVFRSEEGDFLFVLKGKRAELVYVTIQQQIKDEIAVSSGLKEGDQVVVTGYSTLQNGSRVELVQFNKKINDNSETGD